MTCSLCGLRMQVGIFSGHAYAWCGRCYRGWRKWRRGEVE